MGKVLALLICGLALGSCAPNRKAGWTGLDTLGAASLLASEITRGQWLQESGRFEGSPVLVIAPGEDFSGASLPLAGIRMELIRQILASGMLRLVMPETDAFEPVALALDSGADAVLFWKAEPGLRKRDRLYWFDLRIMDAEDGRVLHAARLSYPQPGYQSRIDRPGNNDDLTKIK